MDSATQVSLEGETDKAIEFSTNRKLDSATQTTSNRVVDRVTRSSAESESYKTTQISAIVERDRAAQISTDSDSAEYPEDVFSNSTNIRSVHHYAHGVLVPNDNEENTQGPAEDTFPSMNLERTINYLREHKLLSSERVLPNLLIEKCPKQLFPKETHCVYCKTELGRPTLTTRSAMVVSVHHEPTAAYQAFQKECPDCHLHYRYQEVEDGIFNFDNRLFLSYQFLLHIRAGLMTHIAISKSVSMLEYKYIISLNHQQIEHAYLAFESLVEHDYTFVCVRCGHHPKILVHNTTKKAVFHYTVDKVTIPESPVPQVDVDTFWTNIQKEMLSRCFLSLGYQGWAPYIGPFTRRSELMCNTEYEKLKPADEQDHHHVTEEVITHLLTYERLDTVRRFCHLLGVKAQGSKLDMMCALASHSLSKSDFDNACASIYGHSDSGGMLSSTCPHNVTYAVKFLLRAESPRDYVDILRSMKHVPTINVVDIANRIAKVGNMIIPGLFHPNDGRLTEPTEENIVAAKSGSMTVRMPFPLDDRPKQTIDDSTHPITGSSDKYMLFNRCHKDNCIDPKEYLRRSMLVTELAGHMNTRTVNPLHRAKAHSIYWLKEMRLTDHIFACRLITQLKNMATNQKTIRQQQKVIPSLVLNANGQMVTDVAHIHTLADATSSSPAVGVHINRKYNHGGQYDAQVRGPANDSGPRETKTSTAGKR